MMARIPAAIAFLCVEASGMRFGIGADASGGSRPSTPPPLRRDPDSPLPGRAEARLGRAEAPLGTAPVGAKAGPLPYTPEPVVGQPYTPEPVVGANFGHVHGAVQPFALPAAGVAPNPALPLPEAAPFLRQQPAEGAFSPRQRAHHGMQVDLPEVGDARQAGREEAAFGSPPRRPPPAVETGMQTPEQPGRRVRSPRGVRRVAPDDPLEVQRRKDLAAERRAQLVREVEREAAEDATRARQADKFAQVREGYVNNPSDRDAGKGATQLQDDSIILQGVSGAVIIVQPEQTLKQVLRQNPQFFRAYMEDGASTYFTLQDLPSSKWFVQSGVRNGDETMEGIVREMQGLPKRGSDGFQEAKQIFRLTMVVGTSPAAVRLWFPQPTVVYSLNEWGYVRAQLIGEAALNEDGELRPEVYWKDFPALLQAKYLAERIRTHYKRYYRVEGEGGAGALPDLYLEKMVVADEGDPRNERELETKLGVMDRSPVKVTEAKQDPATILTLEENRVAGKEAGLGWSLLEACESLEAIDGGRCDLKVVSRKPEGVGELAPFRDNLHFGEERRWHGDDA